MELKVLNKTIQVQKKSYNRTIKRIIIFVASSVFLSFIILLSLRFGSVRFSTSEIMNSISNKQVSAGRNIIVNIRIPRTLLCIMVGANLAVSGALLQAVMRNPLADPGLTGVSTGAGLAAVAIMLAFPSMAGFLPFVAFLGGAAASIMVFTLAWKSGIDPIRIILAGVAVNAILGGGISLLTVLYSDRIQGALMWLNGSISGKGWNNVSILAPYSVVGLLSGLFCIKTANILQLGEDVAKNLGLNVNNSRLILSIIAAFLAGISVSTVGLIGFIGLIIPHISRLLVGSDYRFMLPLSAILGSMILLFADILSRTLFSPVELPVGIIMAIFGGPFFLYHLRKRGAYKI